MIDCTPEYAPMTAMVAPYKGAPEKGQPPGIEDLADVLQELNNVSKVTGLNWHKT